MKRARNDSRHSLARELIILYGSKLKYEYTAAKNGIHATNCAAASSPSKSSPDIPAVIQPAIGKKKQIPISHFNSVTVGSLELSMK